MLRIWYENVNIFIQTYSANLSIFKRDIVERKISVRKDFFVEIKIEIPIVKEQHFQKTPMPIY